MSAGFGMRGWEWKMDTCLGSVAGRQGDRDRAESFCRAAVELARDLALPTAEVTARTGLAAVLAGRMTFPERRASVAQMRSLVAT